LAGFQVIIYGRFWVITEAHDCRRTCARLCHAAGGELEQIQFLLGHVSVETTERYLGCKQRLRHAVNDKIGLEPKVPAGPVCGWPISDGRGSDQAARLN
jgi:integrase